MVVSKFNVTQSQCPLSNITLIVLKHKQGRTIAIRNTDLSYEFLPCRIKYQVTSDFISQIKVYSHNVYTGPTTFCGRRKTVETWYCLLYVMGGSLGDVSEEPVTQEKRKDWKMSYDVGKATEGLENEL